MINDPVLVNDWHIVAWSQDVVAGKPYGTRLLGEDIVLWRACGALMAWQDLCLHRGTRLSLGRIKDDCTLVCPYHGWTYNTQGAAVSIPAHPDQKPPTKARVKTYHVREQYGAVWVCPGEPANDIPYFAEAYDPAFRLVQCGPYTVGAAGTRLIENFLDVAHFPFVHEGLLGDQSRTEITDYEVEWDELGIVAKDIQVYQPDPDGTGIGKDVSYTYRVLRPLTAHFAKNTQGPKFAMLFNVSPVEPRESIGFMWVAMNYGHDIPDSEVSGFQDKIFAQDVPIVMSQRPELLPLDLQAELHLRSDRTAIAYRKWLNELGLTFGTA